MKKAACLGVRQGGVGSPPGTATIKLEIFKAGSVIDIPLKDQLSPQDSLIIPQGVFFWVACALQ